jgi:hypothetical protein
MDTAAQLTQNLIFLLIYIFLIVFLSIDKKLNSFVKGLLIVGLSIRIIAAIAADILSFTFRVWTYWDNELAQHLVSLGYLVSYFILLYCFSFFIGKTNAEKLPANENLNVNIKKRKIWLSVLLFFVTAGIYGLFWLYRTVKDLKSISPEIPYTPGQAVGFLFIPVFNLYWIFRIIFTLPLYTARIEKKYYIPEHRFQFHPVFISLLWVLFIILSYLGVYSQESDNFSFVSYFYTPFFCMFSIWVLFLTIQAKINSFAEVSVTDSKDQIKDFTENNPGNLAME